MDARFESHLADAVWETILKVGYSPSAISLNYPPKTLKHLLSRPDMTDAELYAALAEREGIALSRRGDVCVLTISRELVERIYRETEPPRFLARLIAAAEQGGLTPARVHEIFEEGGGRVEFFASDHADFDERIRFLDGSDPYVYCFLYDDHHTEYHRLLREDYEQLYGALDPA